MARFRLVWGGLCIFFLKKTKKEMSFFIFFNFVYGELVRWLGSTADPPEEATARLTQAHRRAMLHNTKVSHAIVPSAPPSRRGGGAGPKARCGREQFTLASKLTSPHPVSAGTHK